MTDQNRRYIAKEIGRLLSEIWKTIIDKLALHSQPNIILDLHVKSILQIK